MTQEATDALVLFVILILIVASVLISIRSLMVLRASSKDMFEGFLTRFPGKCPICSYHRYGMTHGFKVPPQPDPHENCPERTP